MKGKGKGYELSQGPGWVPPYPSKGKGKGNKGAWGPGKGSYGKGGKGVYGFEDEWSEGVSGCQFGQSDTPLWYTDLAGEAASEWKTPAPRKTCKPALSLRNGGCAPAPPGGKCSHCSSCKLGNPISRGRFAALADDQCEHDPGTPMPIMMLAAEGDVPQEPTTTPDLPKTYKAEKTADGSIKLNLIQHFAPRTVTRTAMKTELMDKWRAQRAGETSRVPPVTTGTSSEHSRARGATVTKVTKPSPEHYEMSTPPTTPHYLALNSNPISRKNERTIAQRNWDIAKSNAKSLF